MRIAYILIRLFLKTPYYFFRIWWCSIKKKKDYNHNYEVIKKVTKGANRAGNITIESHGLENIPKENGFIFFPNHQGLFDVLTLLESCPVPFAFVIKKEASKVILLKQIIKALGSIPIDRDDIKQSMQVINQVADEVKNGRNFLIFPEGTRSREGNKPGEFKGGSFKSATKAKCPIVPCALIDAFKPFDEKSVKPLTVKLIYLEPIYYDEYKDMKTTEIATMVRERIVAAIDKYQTEPQSPASE